MSKFSVPLDGLTSVINSPSGRLRCPAGATPVKAGLHLADRGTNCALAPPAPGGARALYYLLRYAQSVKEQAADLRFFDVNTSKKAKKNTTRMGGVLFGSPCWTRTNDLRINSPSLYRLS